MALSDIPSLNSLLTQRQYNPIITPFSSGLKELSLNNSAHIILKFSGGLGR